MSTTVRRIGLLTGGGDCPGLNAVIRTITLEAAAAGIGVVGFRDGYRGLIEDRVMDLTADSVRCILDDGGTILGTCNRSNPKAFIVGLDPAGNPIKRDVRRQCVENITKRGIDALVVAGGDGSLTIADSMEEMGVRCIGVPKTIDNDIEGTDLTFGFLTAVSIATEALDRVRTTAASHQRIIVVEVMGRNSGFLALHAGVAGAADAVLIPEIPFSIENLAGFIRRQADRGRRSCVICVAEGAKPLDGTAVVSRIDPTSPDPIRLGGIAKVVADALERETGMESRHVVLGHVQRGGTPVAADRVLATELAHAAMRLVRSGARGRMVAMRGLGLTDFPIRDLAGKQRKVWPEHPLLSAARAIGTCMGD